MTIIDLDNNFEYATSILDRGIFSSMEDVAKVAFYLNKQGLAFQNAYEKIKNMKWDFKYEGTSLEKAFYYLYLYPSTTSIIGDFSNVILYDSEIEILKEVPDYNTRRFLYFSLIIAKWNGHSSGWIKYDKEAILYEAGLRFKDYPQIVKQSSLHGLLFRVIGSKNPITCYTLSFLAQDGKVYKRLHSKKEVIETYQEVFGSV